MFFNYFANTVFPSDPGVVVQHLNQSENFTVALLMFQVSLELQEFLNVRVQLLGNALHFSDPNRISHMRLNSFHERAGSLDVIEHRFNADAGGKAPVERMSKRAQALSLIPSLKEEMAKTCEKKGWSEATRACIKNARAAADLPHCMPKKPEEAAPAAPAAPAGEPKTGG